LTNGCVHAITDETFLLQNEGDFPQEYSTYGNRIVRLRTNYDQHDGLRGGTVSARRSAHASKIIRSLASAMFGCRIWPSSAELVSWATSEPFTPKRWSLFERRYRQEMRQPTRQSIIALRAALSSQTNFSVGCYCEEEGPVIVRLRQLILEHGAKLA
jgi:uncharacterized protein YeaO (DUF488 family)